MKKYYLVIMGFCTCLSLSGCGLMEVSFKAGFIMALVLVVLIGLLIWIFHFSWKLLHKYFPAVTMRFEGFWDE